VNVISIHADYQLALGEIKQRIEATQMRAVLAANYELLSLYWYIGRKIVTLQQAQGWGGAVVEQMAADLQAEHPGIQGFSRTSLFAMRQFYLFLSPRFEVVPQPVGQLPWGISARFLAKSRRSRGRCPNPRFTKSSREKVFRYEHRREEEITCPAPVNREGLDAGIAQRKTAAEYLKALEKTGIMKSMKIGKQTLYLNKGLYDLLSH
jgi:hypothetical protein